jgi:hypothetical protein
MLLGKVPAADANLTTTEPISKLCLSLFKKNDDEYCGFLALENDDSKYYVYNVSNHRTASIAITLDQILRGEIQPRPGRRQRYELAAILASSFLQFIDTPWLPSIWRKSDIVFFCDASDALAFNLDQPYLCPRLTDPKGKLSVTASKDQRGAYSQALDVLGIILL